jgi:hypothetical protein
MQPEPAAYLQGTLSELGGIPARLQISLAVFLQMAYEVTPFDRHVEPLQGVAR